MLEAPNMLMLGSAGRDSGKTLFACRLIERLSAHQPIAAAKVTTIRDRGGRCPRGGEGCGVCTSLHEDYCITRETQPGAEKDTQRMLAAGAHEVYWLRVLAEHLDAGAEALLKCVDPDIPLICETNSLREAVTPSLFLMFRNAADAAVKATARTVQPYADRMVVFNGSEFDLPGECAAPINGRWALDEFPVCGEKT